MLTARIAGAGITAIALSALTVAGFSPAVGAAPARPAAHLCFDEQEGNFPCPAGDINGDGSTDVPVGVPNHAVTATPGSGLVDIHLSRSSGQRIDEQWVSPGFTAAATDGFGTTSAGGDVDADGYGDLVVGAPGAGGTGAAFIAHGCPSGIVRGGAQVLRGRTSGERFGATMALNGVNLWIGAPNRTVSGHAGAGALDWYVLGSDHQFHLRQSITQDSPGIGGSAETGDGFGAALAAADNGLLVGVPTEDIGSAKDAGLVTYITVTTTGYTSVSSEQNSPGVLGAAEAGDRFGASVAIAPSGRYALVGVPDEDTGTIRDAGLVQVYAASSGNPLNPSVGLSQGTPGVPGDSETSDHFGAAVAFVTLPTGSATPDSIAVGVPGEDVGSIRDAGVLDTHAITPAQTGFGSGWQSFYRGTGHGLGGTLAAGDQVGATLSSRIVRATVDDNGYDPLLVGAPGQLVSGRAGAGTLIEAVDGSGSFTVSSYTFDYTQLGGATTGAHYGANQTAPLSSS